MTVDSFKFLPRIIAAFYQLTDMELRSPIPWTPLERPLDELKVGLVTSGGMYVKGEQPPFDLEREREQPTWGDPSYREIPHTIKTEAIGVSHLHLNTDDIEQDFNILLPIQRIQELVERGQIGGAATTHFSFMGYQGYPPNTQAWEQHFVPHVAEKLIDEGVHVVILTPA
jgi:D-proline reductase (dithiol) PrdB